MCIREVFNNRIVQLIIQTICRHNNFNMDGNTVCTDMRKRVLLHFSCLVLIDSTIPEHYDDANHTYLPHQVIQKLF